MSTRPLWALTRATDRSFGGAFNFASKSVLPSLRRRLFAPPEAAWYWRSVFRRQFPSCVPKTLQWSSDANTTIHSQNLRLQNIWHARKSIWTQIRLRWPTRKWKRDQRGLGEIAYCWEPTSIASSGKPYTRCSWHVSSLGFGLGRHGQLKCWREKIRLKTTENDLEWNQVCWQVDTIIGEFCVLSLL